MFRRCRRRGDKSLSKPKRKLGSEKTMFTTWLWMLCGEYWRTPRQPEHQHDNHQYTNPFTKPSRGGDEKGWTQTLSMHRAA